MRILASTLVVAPLLQIQPVMAQGCLTQVADFAVRICGEIQNSGTSVLVDSKGKVDANVGNIIRGIVGGASGSADSNVLYKAFTGVVQNKLGDQQFNVITCRKEMVSVAIAQACAVPNPPPPPPHKETKVCMGNGGGPSCSSGADVSYNCDTYKSMGAGTKQTYETLGDRFCQYDDNGTMKVYPHTVIVTYDVGGGQCGWTRFQVTCNPR